jgi:hypothetical protein
MRNTSFIIEKDLGKSLEGKSLYFTEYRHRIDIDYIGKEWGNMLDMWNDGSGKDYLGCFIISYDESGNQTKDLLCLSPLKDHTTTTSEAQKKTINYRRHHSR